MSRAPSGVFPTYDGKFREVWSYDFVEEREFMRLPSPTVLCRGWTGSACLNKVPSKISLGEVIGIDTDRHRSDGLARRGILDREANLTDVRQPAIGTNVVDEHRVRPLAISPPVFGLVALHIISCQVGLANVETLVVEHEEFKNNRPESCFLCLTRRFSAAILRAIVSFAGSASFVTPGPFERAFARSPSTRA